MMKYLAICLTLLLAPAAIAGDTATPNDPQVIIKTSEGDITLRLFRDARQAGDVERTAELYRQMRLYAIPTNLTESGLLKLAYLLRKGGHRREAAQAFLEIVNRYPDGPKAEIASIRRAELLWELGETEDALLEYERLLASHPESDWRELAEGRVDSIRALTGRSGSPPPSGNRSPSATPASPARSAAGPRRSRNRSEA